MGLTAAYEERRDSVTAILRKDYGWALGPGGSAYINSTLTTLEPSGAAAQTLTTQTLDAYGNLTQSAVYEYGKLTEPARTYNYTYLHRVDGN